MFFLQIACLELGFVVVMGSVHLINVIIIIIIIEIAHIGLSCPHKLKRS